jgi:hypothetical protein
MGMDEDLSTEQCGQSLAAFRFCQPAAGFLETRRASENGCTTPVLVDISVNSRLSSEAVRFFAENLGFSWAFDRPPTFELHRCCGL